MNAYGIISDGRVVSNGHGVVNIVYCVPVPLMALLLIVMRREASEG
jgi:hypothetical protein